MSKHGAVFRSEGVSTDPSVSLKTAARGWWRQEKTHIDSHCFLSLHSHSNVHTQGRKYSTVEKSFRRICWGLLKISFEACSSLSQKNVSQAINLAYGDMTFSQKYDFIWNYDFFIERMTFSSKLQLFITNLIWLRLLEKTTFFSKLNFLSLKSWEVRIMT